MEQNVASSVMLSVCGGIIMVAHKNLYNDC